MTDVTENGDTGMFEEQGDKIAEFASPAPVAAGNDSRLQPKESMIEGEFSRVEQSPEDVFVDGVILHRIANQVAHRS